MRARFASRFKLVFGFRWPLREIEEVCQKILTETSSSPVEPPEGDCVLKYEVLENLAQIEAIASSWDQILENSACNRAFSCSTWFLATCSHNSQITPHVVIAKRGTSLAGVLPLASRNDNKTVDFPSAISDYNDLVTCAEDHAVQSGLLEAALSSAGSHQLVLSDVRPDSNCVRGAHLLAESKGIGVVYQPSRNCYYLELAHEFDRYLATRSRAFRKGLYRIRRQAAAKQLEVRQLTPADIPAAEVAELFLSLNASRFQARSGFHSEAAQSFVRQAFPSLFIEGRLIVFALLEGDRPLAIDLCMRGPNSLCTWNGGFLPEAAQLSPGRLLLAAGIERAIAEHLQEYDMLRGSHAYKASWATHSRSIGKLELNLQGFTRPSLEHETQSAHCM